jgi:hypothetical protein
VLPPATEGLFENARTVTPLDPTAARTARTESAKTGPRMICAPSLTAATACLGRTGQGGRRYRRHEDRPARTQGPPWPGGPRPRGSGRASGPCHAARGAPRGPALIARDGRGRCRSSRRAGTPPASRRQQRRGAAGAMWSGNSGVSLRAERRGPAAEATPGGKVNLRMMRWTMCIRKPLLELSSIRRRAGIGTADCRLLRAAASTLHAQGAEPRRPRGPARSGAGRRRRQLPIVVSLARMLSSVGFRIPPMALSPRRPSIVD